MFSPWEEKKADFLRLNAKLEALRGWAALRQYYKRHPPPHSNHFNPNQPRVSAGNPDGGQWTSVDGGSEVLERIQVAGRWTPRIPPPQVSRRKPPNNDDVKQVVKDVAKWLLAVGGSIAKILGIAPWLREHRAEIESYRDPPKTLEELQRAALQPSAPGYQDHHIVEQTPARNRKEPDWKIDAPDNLVRIPTLKHREISGWYGRKNAEYPPWPRAYLREKGWEERREVGLKALLEHGVLKP